ncbi:hypothetical protein B0J12DRAFT_745762 [Macrophomina phaseolina]|uniref:Uncharacterized protein n=1 Tax=Macrophomina phaseolina TaxID=35725 RepID=A0ABQ8FWT7_9PEZI|nr:hypothetical protein B0J12DRAFT_745762 [Macrophomina phaseolina]
MIGNETASRLGEWIGSTAPQALWLSGPYLEADVLGNPTSMLSAKILNLAAKNGIPVASYFCELRRRECLRPGNSTEEQQGVVALLYALPRQMIELLPPLFDEMDIDLSKRRFDQLDGTVRSFTQAMSMFRALLELIPRPAICIVDGL